MELDAEEAREEHARGTDYAQFGLVEQVGIVGSMTVEIGYDFVYHSYTTNDVMKSQEM